MEETHVERKGMIAFVFIAALVLIGALGVLFAPKTRHSVFFFLAFLLGCFIGAWWLHAPWLVLLLLGWGLVAGWHFFSVTKDSLPETESGDRRYWGGLVAVLFTLAAYRIVLGGSWGQENYSIPFLLQDLGGKHLFLAAGEALLVPFGIALGVFLLFLAYLVFLIRSGRGMKSREEA